jgi:hypothetical protein
VLAGAQMVTGEFLIASVSQIQRKPRVSEQTKLNNTIPDKWLFYKGIISTLTAKIVQQNVGRKNFLKSYFG